MSEASPLDGGMNRMNPRELKISDIHLVAFLLTRGFRVVRVEGVATRRQFVFQDIPQEAVLAYFGGDDLVSARALLDALRNVRGLVAQEV